MRLILGIDPGLRCTGYGVIEANGQSTKFIGCGCIRTKKSDSNARLGQIFDSLDEIIELYNPNEVAIEKVFVHANVNSALKLGQARGAAIVAASRRKLEIFEYSARQVKQAVVGYGGATKQQIQRMVQILFKHEEKLPMDASDALAIALCHAHTNNFMKAISRGKKL